MKKSLFIILILFFIIGCSQGQTSTEAENKDEQKQESQTEDTVEKSESIEVDKNLLSVELTLPASFFEFADQDIDQVIAEAKADGVKEVIQNDDGSLTYKMSKARHKEMMKEMEDGLKETIEEMKISDDFTSIQDIKSNKSNSEFTIIVDREAFENSFDGFAALGIAFSAMFYQVFAGVNPDKSEVTINFEDGSTGELFNTVVYPDALEEE